MTGLCLRVVRGRPYARPVIVR